MGKLEREAKQVTTVILEVGGRFGFLGGQVDEVGIFSLGWFFMLLLSLLLIFSSAAPVSC
jgi:hypothetical protein